MAIEIKLPELGEGIETADVLEVLVAVGDSVKADQGIIELETDKATAIVPTPRAGRVSKIHIADGDTVSVGQVLLTLEATEAATATGPAPAAVQPPSSAQTAAETPETTPLQPATAAATPPPPAPVGPPVEVAPPVPAAASVPDSATDWPPPNRTDSDKRGNEIAAGPAMRRFARELGVDLSSVTGSGDGGRITRDDILSVVRSGGTRTAAKSGPAGNNDGFGPVRYEKMSRMRRTIAEQMHRSWSTVPRVTNFDDADVTDLEQIRISSKSDYAARGIKLTSLPFVIKAVAMALRNHPVVNASIDMDGGQVVYREYVNVGIAVDSERGLVVPSLRNADALSIPEIAKRIGDLAEQIRTNQFSIEDLRGSTFTISNLGAIGGTYSTPIINTPETAILLIGRSRKLPVVVGDVILPRLMMPLSISYDHRLIDGGAAARFLNDVIGYLEAPSRLLLAP
jgi:pyruvate/2-oxoglutarate dehydrogenase complex dihydrolipoamide acyltransferase (E2) component